MLQTETLRRSLLATTIDVTGHGWPAVDTTGPLAPLHEEVDAMRWLRRAGERARLLRYRSGTRNRRPTTARPAAGTASQMATRSRSRMDADG